MDEIRDLVKQLRQYVDAITGFATVQLVAFVFLVAHGDCFSRNIEDARWWFIAIGGLMNVLYLSLVHFCHQAEDQILDQTHARNEATSSIVKRIRYMRYAIISVDGRCHRAFTADDPKRSESWPVPY
jgi:hypothetical protein